MSALHDVIIVGGSYAGMAAGLQLARARQDVVFIDAGQRRNRFAAHAHGFLTQDGVDPAEIAAIAKAQLLKYPTIRWREGEATEARVLADGFAVALATGEELRAKRLVLAVGVADVLPEVPGLVERWGTYVHHCPYCHGYELNRGPIGAIGTSPLSAHHAVMVSEWGPTTLFTRGLFAPDAEQAAALARRNIAVETGEVAEIVGKADVRLADGRVLAYAGLFVTSRVRIASPLIAQLGVAVEESPIGSFVKTDAMAETSVRGVFACGDLATPAGSVAIAVGAGTRAGTSAHQSLIFR